MRAIAIDADEHGGFVSLLDEMHQLRAQIAGRLGWRVKVEWPRQTSVPWPAVPVCFRPQAQPCCRTSSRNCSRAAGYGANRP